MELCKCKVGGNVVISTPMFDDKMFKTVIIVRLILDGSVVSQIVDGSVDLTVPKMGFSRPSMDYGTAGNGSSSGRRIDHWPNSDGEVKCMGDRLHVES